MINCELFRCGEKRENTSVAGANVFLFRETDMATRGYCRFITIAMMIALLLGFGVLQAKAGPAFGAEEAALDVYYDDTCLKSFSMSELQDIADKEGSKQYTFSGFNTYPTAQLFEKIEGPTVEGILNEALQTRGESAVQIEDGQLIGFRASDGLEERFLKGALLTSRYYFPMFRQEQGRQGQPVLESSMAEATEVPAVISLREEGFAYGESGRYEVGRLLFGQKAPNEQNHSMFVKYMATKDAEKAAQRGRIIIYSQSAKAAETLQPIRTTDRGAGGKAEAGTAITLDRSVNRSHREGGSRYWIYFTTDGSEPDMTSAMYNYNNNSFGAADEKINYPTIGEEDRTVIRVKVMGYDRYESQVSAFTFLRMPGRAAIAKISSKGRAVTIKWKAAEGARGYVICRAAKKAGKYKVVKTVTKRGAGKWKNTRLKKGKTYYYKIRAYRLVSGKKVYGSYSAVKKIKVK